MRDRQRWALVFLFAVAMAWMESATVYYLRTVVGRIEPYQPAPLPRNDALGETELVREFATLVMLVCAGWLAGRNLRSRFGYFLVAFGVWDILYYVFLALITGWPNSLVDWDVLFLLPLPWWGPVIAPASIAALMLIAGTLITQGGRDGRTRWPSWPANALNAAGVALALFVFMKDALAALPDGSDAVRAVLPERFDWPLYLVALALIAAPVVDLLRQVIAGRHTPTSSEARAAMGRAAGIRDNA